MIEWIYLEFYTISVNIRAGHFKILRLWNITRTSLGDKSTS